MELTKITELTNRLCISSRTLRYYEQTGLIQSVRPPFEKYRYYDGENVERIAQIVVLRKMQIPVKDIIGIYQSRDMTVLVESFVSRINAIDSEIEALGELRRIVNEFLQSMLQNGIRHISALPLLYEKMDRQLAGCEEREELSLERLSAVSEKTQAPPELCIVDLPPMRALSSRRTDSGRSDVEGFWSFLRINKIPYAAQGSHGMFEFQNDADETVLIRKIEGDFQNTGPYADYEFPGGLFAVGAVYVDDDIAAFHQRMVKSFDENPYFEVDWHGGRLRQESLVESVLSPDSRREKINVYLPVKKRLPDAERSGPLEQLSDIGFAEIERDNPALCEYNVPLKEITPVLSPHYKVLDSGEAEYICWISARQLSTNVSVSVPFRVDMQFRVEAAGERFGYGSDEGSIRFYHGNNLYGLNMENKADSRLSKEALCFHQPVVGNYYSYPLLGRIKYNEYNTLTWIVGEKHFAVVINGEVRYCGVRFPYMESDLYLQRPETILIGSDGQGKKYFKAIRVTQLKTAPRIRIKGRELAMITRRSNNRIPNLHQLITMHYGENYWFNGCAKYVMECLGEKEFDYSFFAGLTGDNFAQVYSYDRFRGDGVTDYLLGDAGGASHIEGIFAACGYAATFVTITQLRNNTEMYLQTLTAYIDRGVPVILNHWGGRPRNLWGWGVFVGYEDYGKTLLYMTADLTEPMRIKAQELFPAELLPGQADCNGWVFVGEKKKDIALADIYRRRIQTLPALLGTKTKGYCFGAEAFRAWAAELDSGRFDDRKPEEFDSWPTYTVYVCCLATNSSCCHDFLAKAEKLNPGLTFLGEVHELYVRMSKLWNAQNGEDLEAIGGGFNITLAALQDGDRRGKITAKLREFAQCMDRIEDILRRGAGLD